MENHYQILEVSPDASQETIKEQYRFLVQAWHPDKFSSPSQKLKAEEKIKEVNAAYQILGNPAKREEYDKKNRFSRSSNEQKYHEQSRQRQSEDVQRKKKPRGERKKNNGKERVDRERKEAEKHRAEIQRKERINQLDQEISLLNQEIKKLSKELPKIPNIRFGILLILGGFIGGCIGLSESAGLLIFLSATSFYIGIVLIVRFVVFFIKFVAAYTEIVKRKQCLTQLVREKHYLK